MIGFLRGKVIFLYKDSCIIDVGGVGYRVYLTGMTQQKVHRKEEAALFIYTSVREDAIHLYGFFSQEEYDLFLQLISVSGIGPKVAVGILSVITVTELCHAIYEKKTSLLTKLPGIGKKSAERIILELKDKVHVTSDDDAKDEAAEDYSIPKDAQDEAEEALRSLGYSSAEIAKVISKARHKGKKTEDIIKAALVLLGQA